MHEYPCPPSSQMIPTNIDRKMEFPPRNDNRRFLISCIQVEASIPGNSVKDAGVPAPHPPRSVLRPDYTMSRCVFRDGGGNAVFSAARSSSVSAMPSAAAFSMVCSTLLDLGMAITFPLCRTNARRI